MPQTSIYQSFSLWNAIFHSGFLVGFSAIILLLSSVFSWKIILEKYLFIKKQNKRLNEMENRLSNGDLIFSMFEKAKKERESFVAKVLISGINEFQDACKFEKSYSQETKNRVIETMHVVSARALFDLERKLDMLATIASVSPFIGLLGTLSGIINGLGEFAIGGSSSGGIQKIIPAMTEALFATCIGLAVSIPALIAYNHFSGATSEYGKKLDLFITELAHLFEKQISR